MTARCVRFYFEASNKFYFPTPYPFSIWSRSDVCLYAYPGRTVPTSQMHPVCWNHPLIENDQKNVLFTQFMREGFQIQLVKLWKSACQPSSSWQESMPSPPKFGARTFPRLTYPRLAVTQNAITRKDIDQTAFNPDCLKPRLDLT